MEKFLKGIRGYHVYNKRWEAAVGEALMHVRKSPKTLPIDKLWLWKGNCHRTFASKAVFAVFATGRYYRMYSNWAHEIFRRTFSTLLVRPMACDGTRRLMEPMGSESPFLGQSSFWQTLLNQLHSWKEIRFFLQRFMWRLHHVLKFISILSPALRRAHSAAHLRTYRTNEDKCVHHTYNTTGKKGNTLSAIPGPSPNPNPNP